MRTEPRAQLHKPVKKNFYSSWWVHLHTVHPPAYATASMCAVVMERDLIYDVIHPKVKLQYLEGKAHHIFL